MLAALHLTEPRAPHLTDAQWREALAFANRSQMTLALHADAMPAWVREVIAGNLANNGERLVRTQALYREIADCLGGAGVDYVALKGLTQCPMFGAEPRTRPQYDIDLYCPRESIHAAHGALLGLGFEPLEGMERFPTDHLPALVRKTGWQYRGDVFDPEMPLPIELHFQFWNGGLERIASSGVEEFWGRRTVRPLTGLPALDAPDALAYACLHLLKHVLRGSARPFHVYEIACFLHQHADDVAFWERWQRLHPPGLRRLQAVAFRLSREWFGCPAGPVELPAAVRAWFHRFALSPAAVPFDSNKDELYLHFSLLSSRRDALAVARRRLLPRSLPAAVDSAYVPDAAMTPAIQLRKRVRWLAYTVRRVMHHVAALPRVLRSGALWWWQRKASGDII